MDTLKVSGATLYYEVRGSGPVLLLIPGGNGDASPYAPLATALADRYTVVTYDRRGFTRSPLDDGVDPDDDRLGADVEDAIALIDAAGGGRADVFGSSSGAIVGLHLLTRYPDRIATLVAHEPPLVGLLPDAEGWPAFLEQVHETYRRDGQDAAMAHFGARLGMPAPPDGPRPADLPPHIADMLDRMRVNQRFWLDHEVRQYPMRTPDLEALARYREQLVLGGGAESREYMPYQPNLVLAARLDRPVIDFPGNHIGYAIEFQTFPPALAAALRNR
jgi:pimeloyl-ACP methyl ester carboxylesterase